MNQILLELLTFGAVISSLLVITSKNPVIAVVFLISLFINTAGYLILLGVGFIGLSYIIIYIGAITVLFLFIIMMINIRLVDILEIGSEYTKNIPLAIILGLLFIFEIFSIIPFTFNDIYLLYFPINIFNNFNILMARLLTSSEETEQIVNTGLQWWQSTSLKEGVMTINSKITEGVLNFNLDTYDNFIYNLSQIEILGLGLYTSGSIWLFICGIILLLAMISAIILSSAQRTQDQV